MRLGKIENDGIKTGGVSKSQAQSLSTYLSA